MKPESAVLARFLDEVSAHLGRAKGNKDVLLELESAILDRAEEIGGGEVTEESVRGALEVLGDPASVALSYGGQRYLIGPRMYRPFVIYTGILFSIHLVMILVSSVLDTGFQVFHVDILRVRQLSSLLNLTAVALQALFMDIGIMVVIFTVVSRTRRTVRLPRLAFRVETGVRTSLARAVLALLVLVLLNFLRDHLFIVVTEDRVHMIFTGSFRSVLPHLDAYLVLIILMEVGYAFLDERRGLVALDAALATIGVGLMIWFLTREPFITFPHRVNEVSDLVPSLNRLAHTLVHLILIVFAVGFVLRAVKRVVRFRQMWT